MSSCLWPTWVLRLLAGLAVAAVLAAPGCAVWQGKTKVRDPRYTRADWPTNVRLLDWRPGVPSDWERQLEARRLEFERSPSALQAERLAESNYAAADRLVRNNDVRGVDRFYESLAFSGFALAQGDFRRRSRTRLQHLQCDALARLIESGQRLGRLNPACLLQVQARSGALNIPVRHAGFAWSPCDFERLVIYGDYRDQRLTRKYQRSGVGLPLIVVSRQQPENQHRFVLPGMPFAATAVLEPPIQTVARIAAPADASAAAPVLMLMNPLTVETMAGPRGPRAVAGDFSVPLTYANQYNTYSPWKAFLGDTGVAQAQLFFLEPYQPEKIPLVFIHGLLSAPSTFVDMANEVRADPILRQRYQIWAFRYPTGDSFLDSAAQLRSSLQQASVWADQVQLSPATRRTVLIGHSMGGLLAKLQVTHSGDLLWRSLTNAPFSTLKANDDRRQEVANIAFFEPRPEVERVIFIATPHLGSELANSLPGRLARKLARNTTWQARQFQQLAQDNPGLFKEELAQGLPSSVDLLEPGNAVLGAMQCMPFSPRVHVHAIFGDRVWTPRNGSSDGVVTSQSALAAPWETMAPVRATHTSVQRNEAAFAEVRCLLHLHLKCPQTRD